MGGSYLISGRATEAGLAELHELMDRVRTEHPEVMPAELGMLETAVIEVAGNVVEHGTPPGGIAYEFLLEVGGDGLRGTFSDDGEQVVLPDGSDGSDGSAGRDVLAESGRGLLIARAVLTELRYQRRADRNVWSMTRLRPERGVGE